MTTNIRLRPTTQREIPQTARLIAEVFSTQTRFIWLIPDDTSRPELLTMFFEVQMRQILDNGGVVMAAEDPSGNFVGIAAWDAPREKPASILPVFAKMPAMLKASGIRTMCHFALRGLALTRAIAKARPESSHWYLAALCVKESEQGKGIGSLLVRTGPDTESARTTPRYLECKLSLESYYSRFGFRVTEHFQPGFGGPQKIGMPCPVTSLAEK